MERWAHYSPGKENAKFYERIFENVVIVDSHAHLGIDLDGYKTDVRGLIKSVKKQKIDKTIIFPFNDPKPGKAFSAPNDRIFEAYMKHPKHIIPFFRLNPKYAWKKEFDTRLRQGFYGVKLHPNAQKFKISSKHVLNICKEAEKEKLPVLMHTGLGLSKIGDSVDKLVKACPNLKLILGHAAFVDMAYTVKLLDGNPNVFFDTSTLKIFDLFQLIQTVSHKQILFGSDYPYYNQTLAMEMLIDTALILNKTPSQIKEILGKNIMRCVS
ncbi:MAG: amidohydrolase family protein [Candidatus Aenigmatarchaeota archaeon]